MQKLTTAALVATALALGIAPALAANARQPHSNVDKRNDRGNDTGDSQVERLNQQQLDSVRGINGTTTAPMPGLGAPMMQPMAPMPGAPMSSMPMSPMPMSPMPMSPMPMSPRPGVAR